MSAYDVMQTITRIANVNWAVDTTIEDQKIYIWDPADYATLYLDKLYIGIISGKDNIKFLNEHLKYNKHGYKRR